MIEHKTMSQIEIPEDAPERVRRAILKARTNGCRIEYADARKLDGDLPPDTPEWVRRKIERSRRSQSNSATTQKKPDISSKRKTAGKQAPPASGRRVPPSILLHKLELAMITK
jgi:hypothetical protein